MKDSNYPKNAEEFLLFIEDIDKKLKQKKILIHQRPIHAIREVCLRLKVKLPIIPNSPAIPGVYQGESLIAHIHDWYEKKYGNRLKINFSPGSTALLIRGDPWRIDFPMIYGNVKLVFDTCLEKYEKPPLIKVNGTLYANPLRTIKGFTTDLAKSLSRKEMIQLSQFYLFAYDTIKNLFEIKSEPFVAEARTDLYTSVNNIFLPQPHYGQSKWSSLQFAEKMLKCFLTIKKSGFPKSHDLEELYNLAHKNGLPDIHKNIIRAIQCAAAVRYGEISVTLEEAIEAHHASLIVCACVYKALKSDINQHCKTTDQINDNKSYIKEGNFYMDPKLHYFYYCNKIENNLVHWILIESYQHGKLIQAKFSQLIENETGYVLITEKKDLIRLTMMLHNFMQKTDC